MGLRRWAFAAANGTYPLSANRFGKEMIAGSDKQPCTNCDKSKNDVHQPIQFLSISEVHGFPATIIAKLQLLNDLLNHLTTLSLPRRWRRDSDDHAKLLVSRRQAQAFPVAARYFAAYTMKTEAPLRNNLAQFSGQGIGSGRGVRSSVAKTEAGEGPVSGGARLRSRARPQLHFPAGARPKQCQRQDHLQAGACLGPIRCRVHGNGRRKGQRKTGQ
jgi:hypothetical protein